MRFVRQSTVLASLTLLAGAAQSVYATPVSYQFTTDPLASSVLMPIPVVGFGGPEILSALSGLSVTGSFTYDRDTPLTSTTNGPVVFNQANYLNAVSNLTGSVGPGTLSFIAPTGYAN